MTDPSKALFDDYQKFYESKRLTDYSLAEIKALHLDRLPRWLFRLTDFHPMSQIFELVCACVVGSKEQHDALL